MKHIIHTILVLLSATIFVKAQNNNLFNAPDNIIGGQDPNSNGVVGSIGGTINVSALGGATYTIPIQLPEGIQGIQPNLSVNYNSHSGNGLLGWGWELGGTSAITRIGKTLYHDQTMEGVDFNDDRFALDGQRLMEVSGNYGANGTEYRTEVDGMTKIVSYSEGNSSPSYFKVWLADGKIAYYGNSPDSKVKLQEADNVCLWLLNRVEDRDGNYMTYHYILGGSSYHLDNIKYTGNSNAGIGPMFIVRFNYEDRSKETEEKRFVGRNDLNLNCLLKSIDVKKWISQDNIPILYTYSFEHKQRQDISGDYGRFIYDQLVEIGLTYYDYNESPTMAYNYNPTIICYGDYPEVNNGGDSEDEIRERFKDGYITSVTPTGGGWDAMYQGKMKFTGDFNGDGLSDFISVYTNENQETQHMQPFINKGNDKSAMDPGAIRFEKQQQSEDFIHCHVEWIYVCDFNGDGLDDFYLVKGTNYALWKTLQIYAYKSVLDENGNWSYVAISIGEDDCYELTIGINKKYALFIGDFMGRGKSDMIFQHDNTIVQENLPVYFEYSAGCINYEATGYHFPGGYSGIVLGLNKYVTGDFDGDGRTEIWSVGENQGVIYDVIRVQYHDPEQTRYSFHSINVIWDGETTPFTGDFNGDGISDFLVYDGNNWFVKICGNPNTNDYYNGKYKIEALRDYTAGVSPYFGFTIETSQQAMPYYLSVADFNGDGKSDVVVINQLGELHLLYGPVYRDEHDSSKGHFSVHDHYPTSLVGLANINTSDICARSIGNFFGQENQAIMDARVLSMPPLSAYYGVNSITDGMGNRTEFDYGYLVENPHPNAENIYTFNHDAENHERNIYAIALPVKAVKKTTSYNRADSIASPNQYMKSCNEYTYGGVLLHRKGKGILGLTTNTIESYTDGSLYHDYVLRNFNTNMMGNHCAVTPTTENTYLKKVENGHLKRISESTFVYDKHVHTQNDKVYMPLLTDQITDFYSIDCQVNGVPKFLKREIMHNVFGNWEYNCIGSKSYYTATTTNQNITNYQNCEFLGNWGYESYDNDINNWLVQKPINVDVGNGSLLYEDIYYYDTEKPHQLKYLSRFPRQNYGSNLATRTTFTYDVAGNVLTKTISGENDNNLKVRKTKYEYSGYRLLHKKREWLDENQGLYYDTKYYYDPYFNFVTKEINCRGQETLYEQDPLGINCIITSPNGIVTRTQLGWLSDNSGYYKWSYTIGNAPTKTYYDLKGVIQKEETYGFDENQLIVKNYFYNNLGQLEEEEDAHIANASAQVTHYTYDNYNRLRKTVYPNGNIERIIHDADNGFKTSTTITAGNEVKTTSQEVNAIGLAIMSWDESNNTVEYTYTMDGLLETATVNNDPNTTITIKYDDAGNRRKLHDPDYCGNGNDVLYTYDAFGQLISLTTPKGNVTSYGYDAFGRTISRTEGSDVTNWTYYNSDDANEHVFKGLLKEVSINGTQEKTTYNYDQQTRRLSNVIECVNNHNYSPTVYTYNGNGKIASVRYPTSYLIKKNYTSTGHLSQITDANDNNLWTTLVKNGQGQITEFLIGEGNNSLRGVYEYYDDTHFLKDQLVTNQNNEKIHHFHYNYDNFANLACRSTEKHGGIQETFDYDELNRLTQSTVTYQGLTYSSDIDYDVNDYGSIKTKTPAFSGAPSIINAQYGIGGRPHAVSEAVMNNNVFPTNKLQTDYTSFDKLSTVTQYDDNGFVERTLSYTYGYDHQRIHMVESSYGSRSNSKTYIGNCEFRVDPGQARTLTYLSGPMGVFAVYEQCGALYLDDPEYNGDAPSNIEKLHYLFTDHIGSITTIINEKGSIEQELSYDAWGNLRSPYTWSSAFQGTPMLDRGFTGHEHLYNFGLINMNGRMYDPVMSSFLSVDNYVQAPDFSQSFNRYAYCLNNPLRYVDPSGEFVITTGVIIAAAAIIGAGIGTYQGYKTAVSQGLTSWDMAGKMVLGGLIGAASGAASAGVGVAVGGAVAAAGIGGFWGGCITGGVSGFVGGGINGYGMSRLAGNTIEQSLTTSITSGLIGIGTGALLGGVSSGIASSIKGNNFWNGKALPTPRPAVEPLPELTPKSAQSITSDKLSMTPIEEGNYTVQVTIEGEYSVYYGKNSEEAVKYVGITKRNPEIRWAEHLASNTKRNTLTYELVQEATGLTKNQARILEQQYINLYGLEKNGGQLLNQINSIAPSRWNSFNIRIDVIQVPKLP